MTTTVTKSSTKVVKSGHKFETPSTHAGTQHMSVVKTSTITQPRTFKEKKNLFEDTVSKQSRRSSAMKSTQRGGTAKKKRSRFPESLQNTSEAMGPGTYNPDAGIELIAPRSPSPDIKNSRPYKHLDDPSQGPAAYSP